MMTRPNPNQQYTPRRSARALLAATAIVSLALAQGPAAAKVIALDFEDAVFTTPLIITNEFYPLVVNTTKIFRATGADGCEEVHVTVTNTTKLVEAGVLTRVVSDIAYEDADCDGPLPMLKVEETLDYFAQDDAGNVWYLGEATSTCVPTPDPNDPPTDVVCTSSSGAWEAGHDGAVAGIIMLKVRTSGDQYYQEFYEGFAEDQAKIVGVGVKVLLTREDAYQSEAFTGCLKTKEWSDLSKGSVEHKYYCPGIGEVAIDEHHGKELRFELVDPSSALRFRTVR